VDIFEGDILIGTLGNNHFSALLSIGERGEMTLKGVALLAVMLLVGQGNVVVVGGFFSPPKKRKKKQNLLSELILESERAG
jgi:hypothetical protein